MRRMNVEAMVLFDIAAAAAVAAFFGLWAGVVTFGGIIFGRLT